MKTIREKYNISNFNSGHFFEELIDEPTFYDKKFFGGLAIYVHGKMVAHLSEHGGDKTWRGTKYKIDVWDVCLVPTHREHHKALLKLLKGSMIHPVIEKWLYIPTASKHFEATMFKLIELIQKQNSLIGIEPAIKKPKVKKTLIRANKK